jgi:flagellar hook-basal body complex protein FliE
LLTKAIDSVNQTQMEAGQASASIESGDGGVSLVKAMIASQKANVSFQATVQVRNKIVSAYQDIMNMPI